MGSPAPSRWDAARYGREYAFVWEYGAGVVELLNPRPGERILDLGCGTGQLTQRIAAAGAEVVGMDRDPAMIAAAQANYPGLTFVTGDATGFIFDQPFDAIFSNAALHWIRPPEQAAASIARALRPGGRLVAELGGHGNIQHLAGALQQALAEIGASARNPWYFPGLGEYAALLEANGLAVVSAALFDRPTRLDGDAPIENWLRMFGGWAIDGVPEARRPALFRRVEELARPALYRDGAWWADYRRLRLAAIKPA